MRFSSYLLTPIAAFLITSFTQVHSQPSSPWVAGRAKHSEVRLISDLAAIDLQTLTVRVALQFKLEKKWHIYWKEPGSVGFPPRPEWTIDPKKFEASPLLFSVPQFISLPKNQFAFGYEDSALYLSRLARTTAIENEKELRIKTLVNYLVCEVQCIPETAELEISVPVSEKAKASEFFKIIDSTENLLPRASDVANAPTISWKSDNAVNLKFSDAGVSQVFISGPNPGGLKNLKINKLADGSFDVESVQSLRDKDWTSSISDPKSGLRTGYVGQLTGPETGAISRGELTLLLALLFAFLGGLILNLMPCVLPVLLLKAVSILKSKQRSKSYARNSLIATAAGIFVSFIALASVLFAFRSLGQDVGWGFQFQSPAFVSFLYLVILLFALNLFGIFDFSLPTSSSNWMAKFNGSFSEGVFATLLATPCSAPFLGTALTYALSQSGPVLFLTFISMGFGLAAPYLLLAVFPGALKFLPRPGAWMDKMKSILGYSLLIAALWLLYVLFQQIVPLALFGLLLISLLIFAILHEFRHPNRWLFVLFIGIATTLSITQFSRKLAVTRDESAGEKRFQLSETEIEETLAAGKKLFIVVTADWCLSCKFNESTVLETEWFQTRLKEKGFDYWVYDWTNPNPDISAYLKKHGRVGIPFSAFVTKEKTVLLPELLTRSNVEDGFKAFE